MPVADDLAERADLLRFELGGHREIRAVPVAEHAEALERIPLQVDPASVKVVSKGDAQRAFASGNVIRYVPEARGLRAEKFVTIEYAAFAAGLQDRAQTARVRVAVTPLPSAQRINSAPTPSLIP